MRSLNDKGTKFKIQYVYINDNMSKFKVHVFKVYKCGKVTYNQLLNGKIFYRKWIPNNYDNNGYCGMLTPSIKNHFIKGI
jgi:hypothetical protein